MSVAGGPGYVERLDWDSAFFGLEVGRVRDGVRDLPAAAAEAREAGLDCVYCLLPGADAEAQWAAQEAGFRVVDVRVELAADGLAGGADAGAVAATADDRPWLLDLARARFTASRFFADPHFGRQRAAALYAAWVERGLDSPDRAVVVLPERRGFVVCGFADGGAEGVIELITAAPGAQGAGAALMSGAHALFHARGCARASVVTQAANVAALRRYEASGYRVRRTDVWLHWWAPGAHRAA
jgi:ribosomal protein S18 acetylase RimI-like enzyme